MRQKQQCLVTINEDVDSLAEHSEEDSEIK